MMRTHLAIRESGLFQLPSMGTLKAKVSVAQLCLTLCDPMDCSSPGSSVHGILHGALCVGTWQKLELLLRLLQGFKQPDGLISIHLQSLPALRFCGIKMICGFEEHNGVSQRVLQYSSNIHTCTIIILLLLISCCNRDTPIFKTAMDSTQCFKLKPLAPLYFNVVL